jgi:carbon-monoxide dehydrogenase large subunit
MPRNEDARFLTGRACFVDDLLPAGTLHAVVVRSPHGHAAILGIDASAVLAVPGVVGVITGEDIAGCTAEIPVRLGPLPGFDRFLQRPLATDRVRYVGEPVAVVVADDRYVAEDAAELLMVDYHPLPAVTDVHQALRDEVVLHPGRGTNLASRYQVANGDADAAFAAADLVVRRVMKVHRHAASPLETRGLLAAEDPSDGVLRVWGATKVTQWNRRALATMLRRPVASIDLIEVDVGGSFGARGEFYPEDFLVPFAALRFGAPVKWIEDRREHLTASNHSRELETELSLALRRDGTILGLRAHVRGDMGAYVRTNGGVVPSKAAQFLPGPYRIPNVSVEVEALLTNKTPVGTMRGPGRYEANFFRERLMDIAAAELGIEPAELRRRNLVTPAEMPHDIGRLVPHEAASEFDGGDFPAALRRCLEAVDYDALAGRVQGREIDGRRHGIGLCCFVESSGAGPSEVARVRLLPGMEVEVATGISTWGQGHETVLAQICADALGGAVAPDRIRVLHGTTSLIEGGNGTYHSRAVVMGGSAVKMAGEALAARLLAVGAKHLQLRAEDLRLRDGGVWREDGQVPLASLDQLLDWATEAGEAAEATETFVQSKRTYTYGAHVAHVAVDVETGQVEVLRYVSVEDVGRAINPLMVHGQAIGAAVQGMGPAFLDEFVYDSDGQLLTGSLADYLLPTATCFPNVEAITLEDSPSRLNPLGAKGAGEGGIVGCGAALANAVAQALRPLGTEIVALPLGPDRLLRLIPETPRSGAQRRAL